MNSTFHEQSLLTLFDYELYGNYLFNFTIFVLGPFQTIVNILHMIIVNTNAYETNNSKKINYLNFLILNIFTLNLTSFSFFVMINYSNSKLCFIIFYLSQVFNNWSIYLILLLIFNSYVKQNNQRETKSSRKILLFKNLILLFLSLFFHSPIISIGTKRYHSLNSNSTSNYINDCNIFNTNDLILFDILELIFLIIFPFLFSLGMNTIISFKLIKSKRNMHHTMSMRERDARHQLINNQQQQIQIGQTNSINNNHRNKMLARSLRFILRIYSINIIGTLLKLPFYLTRLSKHLSHLNLDQSTYQILFFIESITFIIRTFYYVFTFLINLLFNQSFRKQIIKTFNHHHHY